MPPRHHYWTIILEGKPTAFRAHTEEELVPTLRQLQAKHPDAVMKWFARGRLWESQEIERADATAKRRPHAAPAGERRPRDWRPGGEHKDPRDRFKISRDEKRRRFAENLHRDPVLPDDKGNGSGDAARPPKADRAPRTDGPPRSDRPRQDRPPVSDGARPNRPGGFARGPRTDRPPRFDGPPHARPPHDVGGKPPWKRDERAGGPSDSRGTGPRKFGRPEGDRRPGPTGKPPAGGRPFSGRPPNRSGGGRPGGAGRPPAGGRRFGSGPPRSPGNRKPGGGGKKGGGGGSR